MIWTKKEINTKSLELNDIRYCQYCGKEIKPDVESDDYEFCYYYHCDCEDALKEIAIHEKVNELKKKIKDIENSITELKKEFPKPKYKIEKVIARKTS